MSHYENILASYDAIHRSPLNRATHAIGIPLIVTSVIAVTSYVRLPGQGAWEHANLATALAVLTVAIVLYWSRLAGFAYLILIAACYAVAHSVTTHFSGLTAAGIIAAGFVLGWVFQFIGHDFEGESPQFVKRPENLLLGPVMIMAEVFPAIRPRNLSATVATSAAENKQ
jgi:uncharacterized membrane protein YGL010W